jgi:hypothetical protein
MPRVKIPKMNADLPSSAKNSRGWFRRRLTVDVLFWELSAVSWLLLLPYILTAHGHLDFARHAVGRDFVNYWTAGHLVFTPHVLDVFSPEKFLGWEHRLFDPRLPFHFWSYPPPTFFLVAPLALFPYIPGLIAWTAAGLAALYPAARAFFAEDKTRWLLMAAPAAATNVGLGQNGAFTAALLMGGLALWRSRPIVAGLVLGLLVFKPQIAVLLPVAVLAEGRWRTLWAAAASASALLLLSLLVFGPGAWAGFFGPTLQAQQAMLSVGRGPFQLMMPSPFMAARVLGAPANWAMAAQAPFSLLAVWLVWRAWRSDADLVLKAAVLMTATFIATPQGFNYDLIPASAGALVLLRRDPSPLSLGLALMLWGLPVYMIAAQAFHVVIAPLVLTGAAWKLAQLSRASFPSAHPREGGSPAGSPAGVEAATGSPPSRG